MDHDTSSQTRCLIRSRCFQPYLNVEQRGPTWTAARKGRLGASDLAAAANVEGAYKSRGMLWDHIKNGPPETDATNPALKYGSDMEYWARKEFLEMHEGMGAFFDVGLVIFDEDPRFCASPDGIWVESCRPKWFPRWEPEDPRWLVEFKCPYSRVKYGDVPPHHRAQLLAQMVITGINKCLYCVYVPEAEEKMDVWAVLYDDDAWTVIYDRGVDFLEDYVDKGIRPPNAKRGTKFSPGMERKLVTLR